MRKIIVSIIAITLLLSMTAISTGKSDMEDYYDDELDQYQTNHDNSFGYLGRGPVPNVNYSQAQSFIPQKGILTRVELYIMRMDASYPYVVAIRENLTGENLITMSLEPDEIPAFPGMTWIEFDFNDIQLNVGQTYYIVSYTANFTYNWYAWGRYGSDNYPNGTQFTGWDDGKTWDSNPDADMCFKTYGRDNLPPNPPEIDGQTEGTAGEEYEYTFVATDPNEDDVSFFVDWGDDTNTSWIGPYASGEQVNVSHIFQEQGTYTIRAKAKDTYDLESDWGYLEVTMPKNQQSSQQQNHQSGQPSLLNGFLKLLQQVMQNLR